MTSHWFIFELFFICCVYSLGFSYIWLSFKTKVKAYPANVKNKYKLLFSGKYYLNVTFEYKYMSKHNCQDQEYSNNNNTNIEWTITIWQHILYFPKLNMKSNLKNKSYCKNIKITHMSQRTRTIMWFHSVLIILGKWVW